MSMKNINDTIGNRTRDLPACSALPQPTAPPDAPLQIISNFFLMTNFRKYIPRNGTLAIPGTLAVS